MKDLLHGLLVRKTQNPYMQFARYFVVGGSTSLVDLGVYAGCVYLLHWNVFLAAFLGYTVGFACNHTLSVLWVFERKHSAKKEVTIAYAIAIGGLLWTELLLYLFVSLLGIGAFVAKVLSQVIVLMWNFSMRKKFVF